MSINRYEYYEYYEMVEEMRKAKERVKRDKRIIKIVHKMMHNKTISDKDMKFVRTNANAQ